MQGYFLWSQNSSGVHFPLGSAIQPLSDPICRPASVRLPFVPDATSSNADGSCVLFFKMNENNSTTVRIYHCASFGTRQEGISFTFPSLSWCQASLTSYGPRSNAYLVAWSMDHTQLISSRFDIKTRVSEVSIKTEGRPLQKNRGRETHHNIILDIYPEIWTKFPVASTIKRSSPASRREPPLLQFVTESPEKPFREYFTNVIRQFKRSTQKPTGGRLEDLRVEAVSFHDIYNLGLNFEATSYPAGKWLVELLCLIPIHIAITSGNRFIPLANGVASAEFEQSLLGLDVMQIANSITLGWYESIFASYMATKPVKVISSMGEQSVGKSYALNHFVDTSFAGSAMRCTEGAWLSVTPTDDELIVALDFEGIRSIERSAQEDMLLVVLNVAISNLVLFRNNFALSRDLAGLFTSFQSSTSLINPEQNANLFQSTLCIIIKDVTDGDADEIVGEFFGKFQQIVAEEQEGNFISKLHRGRLNILPWPVIQSKEFYGLMTTLKARLDSQPPTHGNASMFLQTLKALMAKLKASDWGALDQNLASYRAQTLQNALANALIYGVTELDSMNNQLKNLDTDTVIEHETNGSEFWLSIDDEVNPYARRDKLIKLRGSWSTDLERQHAPEQDYILSLTEHLRRLADARVRHVRLWIESNVNRFSSENAEIRSLQRRFEALSRELTSGVEICGLKCASCGLLCVEGKRHEGDHDCGTTHRCIHQCSMNDVSGCGFHAGHAGNHICDVKLHLCGVPCSLSDKQGCQGSCTKAAQHEDGEHMCNAELHACGEPCHLNVVEQDGGPLCKLPCVIDCRKEHKKHTCENRLTCPVKCQLCPHICSTADHGHALQNGAVHLCGQEHPCKELCASPGICEVAVEPKSVESMFVGKFERFQFTKFTQVANRLPCIQRIPKNKLRHEGAHTHSLKPDTSHFCETRCPYCDYFCTSPFGHAQAIHSTSHGSMEQTVWSIDGDEDAVREIEGRKFTSGDSGAPMLCSMVCKQLGRHAHIAYCRSSNPRACSDREVQHIAKRMAPEPHRPKDWITHKLHWARAGKWPRKTAQDRLPI
ncbi:hypothetical protein DL93DRAFT_250101 [Clavulina sp. PMI_390]|nr:hypothetical protein DL93DRAFT_250101 [Clavulina sp. PMI_390]